MKTKRRKLGQYDTDRTAENLFSAVLRDFQAVHSHFHVNIEELLKKDLKLFRDTVSEFEYGSSHLSRFKAFHQVANLLKKYRFASDVYTDSELRTKSYGDYFKDQERLSLIYPTDEISFRVLSKAREIAKRILGEYNVDEVITECKFGSNSSIGCPLRSAYIDFKLSDVAAFTGSAQITKWFRENIFNKDVILRDVFSSSNHSIDWDSPTLRLKSLVLQDVPKTFKTLRLITPLPLLDLYYSNGIGKVVAERLAHHGLNISNLQSRHRLLVERMSCDRKHATADLSKASDSITRQLLNRVLPRAWYRALLPILCNQLTDNEGQKFYTNSVLPMGNGATFPVETLVFYCIVKAIGTLTDINGIYSVYGDDLIYPSRLHKFVSRIFPKLGLMLNLDKTYVRSSFRESCGSDYYHGTDVRPFFLKGEHQLLTKTQYVVYLNKIYNGLRSRWNLEELPGTFAWLLNELFETNGRICRIPPSYPATAGIHVSYPDSLPLDYDARHFHPIEQGFIGARTHSFRYMRERAPHRFVLFSIPYYWLALQGKNDETRNENGSNPNPFYELYQRNLGRFLIDTPKPQLTWARVPVYRSHFVNNEKRTVKKMSKKPCVSQKNLTNIVENTDTVYDWI